MTRTLVDILRCPCCRGRLVLESSDEGPTVHAGRLLSPCGRVFPVIEGVPNLVHPPDQTYLHEPADTYDRSIAFMMRLFDADEGAVRRSLVDELAVERGARILEVACGPGPNLPYLLEAVGPTGSVSALDISPEMLVAAGQRTSDDPRVSLVLGNGVFLPFADDSFDGLLHVGTLNRFDDVRMALSEMARVVRAGGRVVAADEGVAPWLQATAVGQVLARFGTLFQGAPPLDALPAEARDVTLRWLPGHAFFAIAFTVGSEPPRLNLDVELPGRGVTVRDVLDAPRAHSSDDD
ncbi:MAG TPA: methyltransferase domain-containing protein [Vicinamibacterales bacterium]|nr:methyltransferase domain-containing protein [Vicinamibacterales bacterium]